MARIFGDRERDDMMAEVALGIDIQGFLNDTAGRFLMAKAENEAMAALEEFRTLKRSDYPSAEQFAGRVVELQHSMDLPEKFELWLSEAIEAGRNMEEQLKLEDEAKGENDG